MKFSFLLISVAIFFSTPASAQPTFNENNMEVENWQQEALKNLKVDRESLLNHKNLRCIKLNNYWCLKDVGWNGGIGRDEDGHTAFSYGAYAARATVRNLRTAYSIHKRFSALAIMQSYSPSDDCIGGNKARSKDGSCLYGKNPVFEYAKFVSKGITDDIEDDLDLFDENGNATNSLILFMRNLSYFETGGIEANIETIEIGICLENGSC